MRLCAVFALCLSAHSVATLPQATAADGFEWKDSAGKHTDLLYNGKPVLRYMYEAIDESSPERREETMKPYHHVFSPDGTLLTKGPGGLFPHHRGLFYGFSRIKYGDGKEADTWHNRNGEWQSHEQELDRQADADGASHKVAIDWHGRDGKVFAHEERELAVMPGKIGDDVLGWLIEFNSKLTPAKGLEVVHLDGDPQHAGFQFRASQEVPDKTAKQTYYLRPDGKGKEGETRNWDHAKPDAPGNKQSENLPWNAASIVLGGKRYTVLYLDHRENPKPARYSERDYARFGSYFVADATHDNPLFVRYRLWVQPGEMTVDQCNALHTKFNNDPALGCFTFPRKKD